MTIDFDEPDLERIPDESDRASKIEMESTQDNVAKVLRNTEKAPYYFDGETCVECGQEIPKERLKTGAFRDIHCQTKIEFERSRTRK